MNLLLDRWSNIKFEKFLLVFVWFSQRSCFLRVAILRAFCIFFTATNQISGVVRPVKQGYRWSLIRAFVLMPEPFYGFFSFFFVLQSTPPFSYFHIKLRRNSRLEQLRKIAIGPVFGSFLPRNISLSGISWSFCFTYLETEIFVFFCYDRRFGTSLPSFCEVPCFFFFN